MLGDGGVDAGNRFGHLQLDPTQPIKILAQQLESLTSRTFENDPIEFFDEVMDEVLEMPREKRFSEAIFVVREKIREEFGSVDIFKYEFPIEPSLLQGFLQKFLNEWERKIAEKALEEEGFSKNALLIILAGFDVIDTSLQLMLLDFEEEGLEPLSEDEKHSLSSTMIAVYSRVYQVYKKDDNNESIDISALAKDIHYANLELLGIMEPNEDYPNIEEMTPREQNGRIIQQGAIKAYELLDISIGRGAELAEMTQTDFVEMLNRAIDVELAQGPESIEELYSGPDLKDG